MYPLTDGSSVVTTWDPRTNAVLASRTLPYKIGTLTTFSYDDAGRSVGPTYDALNRTINYDGADYTYGPGTMPVNDGGDIQHTSVARDPMFTTDASNNLLDVKLADSSDIVPNDANFTGLTVYDRDMFGFVAAQRNATGKSGWTVPDLYSSCDATHSGNLGQADSNFKGTTAFGSCAPNGLMYPFRNDGEFDGRLTFRGVRSYIGGQWTTPDAFDGSYNYAGNNPALFSDPTGFCQQYSYTTGPGGGYDDNKVTVFCDNGYDGGVGDLGGMLGAILASPLDGELIGSPCPSDPSTPNLPRGASYSANYVAGENEGILENSMIGSGAAAGWTALIEGYRGTLDYQRWPVPDAGRFREGTNFGVGVYAAGAGWSEAKMDSMIAGFIGLEAAYDKLRGKARTAADVAAQIAYDERAAAKGRAWALARCRP